MLPPALLCLLLLSLLLFSSLSFSPFPIVGQIGFGLQLDHKDVSQLSHYGGAVWHTLLLVLIIYAMMPLPLLWCALCAIVTSLIDLTLGIIFLYTFHHDFIRMVSVCSNAPFSVTTCILTIISSF